MNASGWLLGLLLLLLVGAGVATWIRGEGTPPVIEAPAELLLGQAGGPLDLALADPGSGLRSLRVELGPAESATVLLDESYPGNLLSGGVRPETSASLELGGEQLTALPETTTIRAIARDWSWRGFFSGNETTQEIALRIDLDPPRVQVETGLSYAKQGGSGSVRYRVSEPVAEDGVQVGATRYRGYPVPGAPEGARVALFAIAPTEDPNVDIRVFAKDAAGNEATADWPLVVKPKSMPEGNVSLPDSFLQNVVPRLTRVTAGQDLAAVFDRVNTELRAQNEATIRQHLAESSPVPLFEGPLAQMRNSKVTSRFAERRTYFVDGKSVSKAIHYGYDLASTSAAPITAAAAGRVVFADDLGIYGNCVLVDHGLGLGTLYGHLSRIDTRAGEEVRQGSTLGLSGATGLAGGDHLHFAVLVGETYVDPLEWWDAKWVREHVSINLGTLPSVAAPGP